MRYIFVSLLLFVISLNSFAMERTEAKSTYNYLVNKLQNAGALVESRDLYGSSWSLVEDSFFVRNGSNGLVFIIPLKTSCVIGINQRGSIGDTMMASYNFKDLGIAIDSSASLFASPNQIELIVKVHDSEFKNEGVMRFFKAGIYTSIIKLGIDEIDKTCE